MTRGRSTPAPQPRAADPAAWALAFTLAALRLLGAAAPFFPTMALWAFNLGRFLPPLSAWLPWAIGAAVLIPALARRVARPLAFVGGGIAKGGALALLGAGAVPALL